MLEKRTLDLRSTEKQNTDEMFAKQSAQGNTDAAIIGQQLSS